MGKVLIATVGTSIEPIITAIREWKPDHVIFLPSKDTEDLVETICERAATAGNDFGYDILTFQDPDSADEVIRTISALFKKLSQGEDQLIVDYTGGTKTMSAALFAVAASFPDLSRVSLSIERGLRTGASMVVSGTEAPWRQDLAWWRAREHVEEALRLADSHHYASAAQVLQKALQSGLATNSPFGQRLSDARLFFKALDAWDGVRYDDAFTIFEALASLKGKEEVLSVLATLRDTGASSAAPKWSSRSLLLVADLLGNALRRAKQNRYDDALGRLYRSLELFVQIRLKSTHHIDAGKVDTEKYASQLQSIGISVKGKTARLPLRAGYLLLKELHDSVGDYLFQRDEDIMNHLQARNLSIMAHGLQPVNQDAFENWYRWLHGLLTEAARVSGVQLPDPITLPDIRSLGEEFETVSLR